MLARYHSWSSTRAFRNRRSLAPCNPALVILPFSRAGFPPPTMSRLWLMGGVPMHSSENAGGSSFLVAADMDILFLLLWRFYVFRNLIKENLRLCHSISRAFTIDLILGPGDDEAVRDFLDSQSHFSHTSTSPFCQNGKYIRIIATMVPIVTNSVNTKGMPKNTRFIVRP